MTVVILLALALAWAAALLPSWIRNRSEARAADSIMSFRRHLSILQRTTPGGSNLHSSGQPFYRPDARRRSAARRRRRDVLFSLVTGTVLTFAMALMVQGVAVIVFLFAFSLLGAYVALLIRTEQRAREREKVRFLVPPRSRPEPAMLLRRSASN